MAVSPQFLSKAIPHYKMILSQKIIQYSSTLKLFIISFLVTALTCYFPIAVSASVPYVEYIEQGRTLKVPNWDKINFSNLPTFSTAGEINIPAEYIHGIGYNPNRSWSAGAAVENVLMLGDLQDAFGSEQFSLGNLSQITQISLSNLPLPSLNLITWQTPESLAKAIPILKTIAINRIPVLRDFFAKVGLRRYLDGNITLQDAIALLPNRLIDKTLGEVLRLDQYDLSSAIPGLTSTPLGNFLGWQQSFISGVPLLDKIGFGSFPIPISFNVSAVAIVDWLDAGYINPTLSDDRFVSGSGKHGVNKPMRCPSDRPCERIELSSFIGSLDPNYGKKWVVGNQQQVPGGEGILGVIAGGFEPTGRILFSPAFKVILMDIDQATSIATFGINFRFCVRGMTNLGCTPYKFGTIPLFTVKEGDLILL